MASVGILFISDEHLPSSSEEWARRVQSQYGNAIIVIGLGAQEALLFVKTDGFMKRVPAAITRLVVLFSAFLHSYLQTASPYEAIRKTAVFALHKVGAMVLPMGFCLRTN